MALDFPVAVGAIRARFNGRGRNLDVRATNTNNAGLMSPTKPVERIASPTRSNKRGSSSNAPAALFSYPIAIDNDRAIWHGFGNHYWPALYFIDAAGHVRDHHFGEGNYEESEVRIRRLLAAAGRGVGTDRASLSFEARGPEVAADRGSLKSPETYVGHHRAEKFASPDGAAVNTRHLYSFPPRLRLNQWALSGKWTVKGEAAVLNAAGGRIAYRFHARDLHLIMGPAARGGAVPFRVFIDGQPPGAGHGSDVNGQGNGTVTEQRLYQLIRESGPISDRQFEIEFLDSGVEAFAFTFG